MGRVGTLTDGSLRLRANIGTVEQMQDLLEPVSKSWIGRHDKAPIARGAQLTRINEYRRGIRNAGLAGETHFARGSTQIPAGQCLAVWWTSGMTESISDQDTSSTTDNALRAPYASTTVGPAYSHASSNAMVWQFLTYRVCCLFPLTINGCVTLLPNHV